MSWSISVGRLFGSELRIHLTFFLLLAWVAASAYSAGGTAAALQNLLFVVALFACIVAHEFGHALAARRYGIKTPDITLLPIGGLARLERMPENPAHEIIVALAGPAVNVVIWGLLTLALGAETDVTDLADGQFDAASFLGQLATINMVLALFNLIPAFPMDGGRVFRALLSLFLDRVKATRIASMTGQGIALVFGYLGITTGNPLLLVVAVFIFLAAAGESNDVATRASTSTLVARDAMITQFEHLGPADTIDAAAHTLIRTTQHEFPVITEDGTLEGFVTRNAIFKAMVSDHIAAHPVTEIVERDIPRVVLTAPLQGVMDALGKGAPAVAVVDKSGGLIGYVTRENLAELVVLQRA